MEALVSITIGVLSGAGLFLMLRRSVLKTVLGLLLLSQAANLVVLVMGRLRRGAVPVNTPGETALVFTDPLVQALILTAIVIGLGVAAFLIALAARTHQETGSDDLDDLRRLRG
ncbi:MAG: sodium:proton antiporter [Dehalococcoidia bacterium]